jgi:hypothetical protein
MDQRKAYLLYLIGALLLTLGWAAVHVQAEAPQPQSCLPFDFFEHNEVNFTWEDAKKGKTIAQVLNNTTITRTLGVSIDTMVASDGGSQIAANTLNPKPKTLQLLPASSAPIAVALLQDVGKPAQGTYSGFLHVWEAATNTAIYIRIALAVPAEAAAAPTMAGGEPPVPLVDTWKVQYLRIIPVLNRGWPTANAYLPLDIDVNRGEAIALDPNKPLGYLTNPGRGIGTVSWTLPAADHLDLQKRWIKLNFTGLDHPGDYSGKIDLLPDDKEKGVLNLTVTVTDFMVWPVLTILAGIIAAVLGQHYLSVRRPILKLLEDEANTKPLEKGAEEYNYKIVDFERLRHDIQGRIFELRESHGWTTATLDDADPEHKEITDSLKKLDEQVRQWNAFGRELAGLKAALKAVSAQDEPQFKLKAETLLQGGSLAFEHLEIGGDQTESAQELFETRRSKVEKATKLARSWEEWVRRLEEATKALGEGNAAKAARLLPTIAQQAKFELARVKTLLWESPDLDTLEAAEMEKSLRLAEGLVSGLKAYPTAPPAAKDAEPERKPFVAIPQVDLSELLLPIRWIPYSIPSTLPAHAVERLEVIQRILRRSDSLMFWLAVIGGVYSGLTTLYFGKAFGTLLDYVGAFAWGLGTKATLEVVYAAINRLVRVPD